MSTATAQTMKLIPASALIKHRARIDAKLADAVAALRVADTKFGEALEDYEGDLREKLDMMGARLNARLFAGMLDASETPTLPSRVFRAIAKHVNEHPNNPPHVEGAILALNLAMNSLESALNLAGQLDGDEIDERYETPFAALGTIHSYAGLITCWSFVFGDREALEAIVGAQRTLSRSAA